MPHYLVQIAYTTESWAAMVRNPQDREAAARDVIASAGGRMEAFYMAFGEKDAIVLLEAPDNVTVAALAIALGARGALSSVQTTVLMTAKEAMEAMKRAGGIAYTAPADKKQPAGVR